MSLNKLALPFACLAVALVAFSGISSVSAQDATVSGFFDVNEFAVIEFMVGENVASPVYLDITTNGSTNPDLSGADTEILLFSGLGPSATFLVSNDDDGISLASTLSYGAGSGLLLGDAFNLGGDGLANGENGTIPAGSYTLVVGEFSTADPPGGAGATLQDFINNGDFGNEAVDYIASFYTNASGFAIIPEPASVLTLLCGVIGLATFRRR